MQRQNFSVTYAAPVSDVFHALVQTLAFRRWASSDPAPVEGMPATGINYRHRCDRVLREGRVVEVIRPLGITLIESLHDSPCRVGMKLRWRIEPVPTGSLARLEVRYRLNYAASLQGRHWNRRLQEHFARQFSFIGANLRCIGTLA